MVPWMRGTLKKFFLASSTPLAMAAGTSLALPYPTPTVPSPSPTTTSAVKLKRRPPLTTLATRLMSTTRSTNALFSGAPPRRSSRRSRRSPPPPPPAPPGPPPPPRRCCPGIVRSLVPVLRCPSEVQPLSSGTVGQRRDAPVVAIATAVEHHRADPGRLRTLGHQLADRLRLHALVPRRRTQ